jgi:hypothetical protein
MRSRVLAIAAITAGLLVPVVGMTATAQAATGHPAATYRATTATKTPVCTIKSSPYRFVETGLAPYESSVAYIFTVECRPVFSEQTVYINAQQLNNACHGTLSWYSATGSAGTGPSWGTGESFPVVLDDDGNATAVVWGGPSCAATTDLVTADLAVPPYTTVMTHVVIAPPENTPVSLHVYPAREVEDSTTSSVDAIFYAEFPSVYAEQWVEISDPQLSARCPVTWVGADEQILGTGPSVTVQLDDNGNAFVVALAGPSCASGPTLAQADLFGPTYRTLTANFTILSPRVTV